MNISYTLYSSSVNISFKYVSLSSGNNVSILYISSGVNLFLKLSVKLYLLLSFIFDRKSFSKSS